VFGLVSLAACSDNRVEKGSSAPPSAPKANQIKQPEISPKLPSLLAEIDQLEKQCPKLMSGLQAGNPSCDVMLQKLIRAGEVGWCWGSPGATDAEGRPQRWVKCETVASKAPPVPAPSPQTLSRKWFAHNINHSQCIEADSPASMMRSIQSYGQKAQSADLPNGGVEIERDIGGGRVEVFTFYPSMDICISTLPRSQSIPSRYE
jgi:hypothetical protein